MGGRFIMLFCEVFLSHELFCPVADVDRPLFSLGQINEAQSLCGRFIKALESSWLKVGALLAMAGAILDLVFQGKHSCDYSSFCCLCMTASISAHPSTEVSQ